MTLAAPTTDVDNGALFVRDNLATCRWYPARGKWLIWDGAKWATSEKADSEILARARRVVTQGLAKVLANMPHGDPKTKEGIERAAVLRWAHESQSIARMRALIEAAKSFPEIVACPSELDADPWLLNCPNGVLHLGDLRLLPHSQAGMHTRATRADWVPGAQSPLWDGFLATLTAGDVDLSLYLQRVIGYAAFGEWREKLYWFFHGPPDGGKSTLLDVIGGVLGTYTVSTSAATWMQQSMVGGNRGDITRLAGARLVTASEIKPGAKFDVELVKRVTGGDTLVAAAKFEHDIEFKPQFALVMAGNHRPVISSEDEGMWRRMRCVPCTHRIPADRQDRELTSKLLSPQHAPAVLAWIVAGCRMWQEQGIGSCSAVDRESAAYRLQMNPLHPFADDALVITGDHSHRMTTDDMQNLYDQWCAETREKFPVKRKNFARHLRALGISGGDDESRIGRHRIWYGVRDATLG